MRGLQYHAQSPVTPAITLTLAATPATVAAGASASYTATVARTNFTGAVSIAVTGMPAGVTTSSTLNGDVTTVTVNIAATTATGTYTLTTTASGTGVPPATGTFALTVTPAPAPAIALTATPNAITVPAGGAGVAATIGITRTSFTGTVVVAVQSGLPLGATASNVPAGPFIGNSVVVTFNASAATVPGTYNVVLQGAGFQAAAGTVTVALTVMPAASSSNVAMSATPATVTIAPGSGTNTIIAITRTNFSGTVNLAATGAPMAVTLTLTTTATTGNTATLGIAVGAGATVGSYPITVTASGSGIATRFARACEVSRQTVIHYLEALEATFVMHVVRPFASNTSAEIVAAPRVYGFDTGFVAYHRGWSPLRRDDYGPLWEHLVLNELHAARQKRDVQYWRTKSGHEVDFVIAPRREAPMAIECKWSQDAFDPAGMLAFRRSYPQGENVLVAADVKRASIRRIGGLEVRVAGLAHVAGLVA